MPRDYSTSDSFMVFHNILVPSPSPCLRRMIPTPANCRIWHLPAFRGGEEWRNGAGPTELSL